MTTQILYRCQLCSTPRPVNELYHDGRSFITCRDAAACLGEVQRQGLALEAAILLKIQQVNTKRMELINELVRVRHEYQLPDHAAIENRAEIARIEADNG
jgi:hypothetical protein